MKVLNKIMQVIGYIYTILYTAMVIYIFVYSRIFMKD